MKKRVWILLSVLLGTILLIVAANIASKNIRVRELNVAINYQNVDQMLVLEEIKDSLQSHFGNFIGKKRKEIDANQTEKYLQSLNFVSQAEVYVGLLGAVDIKIKQSIPIARIFCKSGLQFYLTSEARLMQTISSNTANVAVINGDINLAAKTKDTTSNALLKDIFTIANRVYNDTVLTYQIDQIYIEDDKTYELFPKIGDYTIKIGHLDDLDEKLEKLVYLYKEGFSRHGWNNYCCVNLCFKNQAVCTEK
jgi:cell division protein FtsQ